MEEAAAVRRAARASVDDVEPARLRDDLRSFVGDGSMVPGALALFLARTCTTEAALDGLAERAAGVQLMYDGLRLTRRLVHDEPWAHGDRATADMQILAADVLVARGFYLLARTDAAAAAVDVVRSFGRDQTRHGADADPNLERDVLELAAIVGTTAVGVDPSTDLLDTVETLADDCTDGFPDAEVLLGSGTRDHLTQSVSSPVADH